MKSSITRRSRNGKSQPLGSSSFRWMTLLVLLSSSSRSWMPLAEASAPVPDTQELKETSDADSKPALAHHFLKRTVIIPHDDKKFRGGEDAASTVGDMLVVADGVGGWANKGVNPGLYSRKLTDTITTKFSAMKPDEKADVDLKKLVHESNHIAADAHLGSATCTVVRLKDASTLETLNIGDSGYSIHRRDLTKALGATAEDLTVAYASVPGQKGFNFPYQLGGQYGDQVHDEGVADGPNTHTLEPNDVIVVVSDGVIDNIGPAEYHGCIHRFQWVKGTPYYVNDVGLHYGLTDELADLITPGTIVSLSAVADCIARKAYFLGKDDNYFSPFAKSAQTYGKRYLGGKHDDITVIVAQVTDQTHSFPDAHPTLEWKHDSLMYTVEDGPIPPLEKLPTIPDLLNAVAGQGVGPHSHVMVGEL